MKAYTLLLQKKKINKNSAKIFQTNLDYLLIKLFNLSIKTLTSVRINRLASRNLRAFKQDVTDHKNKNPDLISSESFTYPSLN